ncbi:MAG: alpha/beta hydrolase [Gemmatimonadaceae bacterium]
MVLTDHSSDAADADAAAADIAPIEDDVTVPREHHLTTTRAARYFVLGTPSPLVRECWVVLHGYGQLAGRFVRHFAAVADSTRLIVAPEALSRFYLGTDVSAHAQARVGASWMTREDRLAEISDYVDYLDALWARVAEMLSGPDVTLGVLGFSQGAATACRWTVLGTAPVRRLVLWGGAVPDDLPMNVLRNRMDGRPVDLVIGDTDPFRSAEAVAAQLDLLRTHAIACRLHTFVGGHHMDADTLSDVLTGHDVVA